MNQTPYYRSLPSILTFRAGGVAGVAVSRPLRSAGGQDGRPRTVEGQREITDAELDRKAREALALSRKLQS